MKRYLLGIFMCLSLFCVGCNQADTIYKNTDVNGYEISGLKKQEAIEKINQIIKKNQNEIAIKLKYQDQTFEIKGSELEIDYDDLANKVIEQSKPNIIKRINVFDKSQNSITIKNSDLVLQIDKQIDEIAKQVDCEPSGCEVIFNDNANKPFEVTEAKDGVVVNKALLKEQIIDALENSLKTELEIPIIPKVNPINAQTIEENLQKRATFSTNYSSSVDGRKFNVQLALSAFNGFKIEPKQVVSFNDVIDQKIDDDEFRTAKIILNGEFVNGKGGGICQASTTLYNALLLAGINVLEVHPHSLPVSYVPLAFDAMVNRGTSDMVFENNLTKPIYIKTWGDETDAYVEIWGEPFEEGKSIRTRADYVGTLPHLGDKIIPDTEGKYADKITFKGEYYRVKMPQEGYESKAVLEYLENGVVVDEKQIRHEYYSPQYGIIYEGTEELIEGIELPENKVKFIPSQKQETNNSQQTIKNKIENSNPSEFNP